MKKKLSKFRQIDLTRFSAACRYCEWHEYIPGDGQAYSICAHPKARRGAKFMTPKRIAMHKSLGRLQGRPATDPLAIHFFDWPRRFNAGFVEDCEHFVDTGERTQWDEWVDEIAYNRDMLRSQRNNLEKALKRAGITQLEDLEGKDVSDDGRGIQTAQEPKGDVAGVAATTGQDGEPGDGGGGAGVGVGANQAEPAGADDTTGQPRRFPFRFGPR